MTLEESMSNNLLRIHSFNNFPREINIFTSFLARAGFYYTDEILNIQNVSLYIFLYHHSACRACRECTSLSTQYLKEYLYPS
jgi:hypothetical protein